MINAAISVILTVIQKIVLETYQGFHIATGDVSFFCSSCRDANQDYKVTVVAHVFSVRALLPDVLSIPIMV